MGQLVVVLKIGGNGGGIGAGSGTVVGESHVKFGRLGGAVRMLMNEDREGKWLEQDKVESLLSRRACRWLRRKSL